MHITFSTYLSSIHRIATSNFSCILWHIKNYQDKLGSFYKAERVGFEPTRPLGQTVFKTASLWPLRYLSMVSLSVSDKMYSITAFHCRQHLFQTFFIFLYFSYFPVFFIYKYTYFSLFIHRTCHLQLLLHILISAEPTIGKFFQMHGNSQIPAQDYWCSINPFAVSRSSGVVILILQ